MLPKLILAGAIILVFALAWTFAPKPTNSTNNTNTIVFFGDSITAGQGAKPGEDFPSQIGKALNVQIANAGANGNTTKDALLRVNKDVVSKKPTIVVLELGSNDLLQHVNPNTTKQNLDLILSNIKPTGAKIVILGVKFVVFQQKYETNWSDLAAKYNATYVPDILEGVITNQNTKFDDIHPNAKGYQKIAKRLTPVIKSLIQAP